MTHAVDSTVVETAMELLSREGFEGFPEALKLLLNEDISPETLRERDPRKLIPPLHGALLKNEQDVMLFERLAFMTRREQR